MDESQQKKSFLFFDKKLNIFLVLILIISFGFYIRISGINKENGLWYDELLCYSFSKDSFPFEIIINAVTKEFQGVLHYLYLGLWMMIFGDSDVSLRFSSLIFGVSLIPVMYFLGKELHSPKLGLVAAFFTAFNPLLVYYSQEVRPYSMLALLGSLSVLFMFRVINRDKTFDYIGLAIVNTLILYSYSSIGFIFIFTEIFIFIIYTISILKRPLKKIIFSNKITILLSLPCLAGIFYQINAYGNMFIEPFFYSKLNLYSPIFMLQDWFTPRPLGIYDHYNTNIYNCAFKQGNIICIILMVYFFLFIIPFIISFIKSLSLKNSKIYVIFGLIFVYLAFLVLAAFSGKFVLISRHTVLIFPLIIVLCSWGMIELQNKKIFYIFMCILVFLYWFSYFSDYLPPIQYRERTGIIPAIKIIEKYNLTQEDIVMVPVLSEFVKKYSPKTRTIDIDYMKMIFFDRKKEYIKKIFSDEILINATDKKNNKITLKNFLISKEPSSSLENYMRHSIEKIPEGRYLFVIREKYYAPFSDERINTIVNDENLYKTRPMFCLFVSKVENDILKICAKNLKLVKSEVGGINWRIYVFQKQKKKMPLASR
jgi:uncharacterized membrane protein